MRILLIGAPNSGKTTLFNWLTGLSAKAVNYPGSTVEVSRGKMASHWKSSLDSSVSSSEIEILDSPGVFGLAAREVSMDEQVTRKALNGEGRGGPAHLVICVIDATQLSRQLILWDQLRDMGIRPLLVFTMSDLLSPSERQGLTEKFRKGADTNPYWIDGRLGGGLQPLVDECLKHNQSQALQNLKTLSWSEMDYVASQARLQKILNQSGSGSESLNSDPGTVVSSRLWTGRLDRIFLHPWLALPVLFLVMSAVFTAVFLLAQPMMDLIDSTFAGLAETVTEYSGGALWGLFLSEGMITGFGAFLVFVPQIAILFIVLAILEGSGYLARTVVLMDRPFSKLGLSGRSLVPILVGFACAVPAMMATRTISSQRDRWITNFILPLMTCSARLPVFALLIGFLFINEPAWIKGMVMAGLYFLSLVLAAIAALVLDRMLPRAAVTPLAIELPLYRWPSLKLILRQTWYRLKSFIENAAPVIFVLTLIIWFLSRFPQGEGLSPEAQLDQSYLGQIGQFLGPIFAPMGVDWRIGIALLSAFAAREVFVATLALIVSGSSETESGSLIQSLATVPDGGGQPMLTTASAAGLLIFFVVALQCLSTVAVALRESGSWKFAIGQLVALNAIAYILAVMTFQILS